MKELDTNWLNSSAFNKSICDFAIKTTKVMAVVAIDLLFSIPMPSFLETISRIQSADQNKLTEFAYKIINVTEHFVTDFQEFKTNTSERIDKIECLVLENVTGYDTVNTEDMKQQVELLKYKNNRLRMESESLPQIIELLSVQQINTSEICDNVVKETGKSMKKKLNRQHDYRTPPSNSIETLPIKEYQGKPESTDEDNSMLPLFNQATSKRGQKKQSTKHHKQPEVYNTNNKHEEPLKQRTAHIVLGKRTYLEVTKVGKKNSVIGNSHQNRIKRKIFQKLVSWGNILKCFSKHYI